MLVSRRYRPHFGSSSRHNYVLCTLPALCLLCTPTATLRRCCLRCPRPFSCSIERDQGWGCFDCGVTVQTSTWKVWSANAVASVLQDVLQDSDAAKEDRYFVRRKSRERLWGVCCCGCGCGCGLPLYTVVGGGWMGWDMRDVCDVCVMCGAVLDPARRRLRRGGLSLGLDLT
jgi:hypothetical protein